MDSRRCKAAMAEGCCCSGAPSKNYQPLVWLKNSFVLDGCRQLKREVKAAASIGPIFLWPEYSMCCSPVLRWGRGGAAAGNKDVAGTPEATTNPSGNLVPGTCNAEVADSNVFKDRSSRFWRTAIAPKRCLVRLRSPVEDFSGDW